MATAPAAGSRKRRTSESGNGHTIDIAAKKKRSSFLADCELWVNLPDLPIDCKLLRYPVDTDRLYAFCASSLEIRSKVEYYPENDLGIPIEAIDPDAYSFDPSAPPEAHPDDELILSLARDCIKADRVTMARRREQYQQEFPVARWFRKPEIMSNSVFSSGSAKRDIETPKPHIKQKSLDADSILQQIEKSFVHHRSKLVHSTNPNLEPVSVLPIYPHDDLAGISFSHIMFDRPVADSRHNKDSAGPAGSHDAVLLRSSNSRVKDYYMLDKAAGNVFNWSARFNQTLSDTAPENKDRLFFLLTPSAALYGDLSARESIQKVLTVDSLSEEERQKIPSNIVLDNTT